MASFNNSLSPNSQLILGTAVVATPLLLFALKRLTAYSPTAEIEMAKKTVVVLGGGWNGSLAARQLSSQLDPQKYELILVNDRPYVINNIASARMTSTEVDKLDSQDKAFIPYDKLFQRGNGTVKVGHAVAVEEDKEQGKGGWVVLEGGEKIKWDSLIIATGSAWQGPLAFPDADALPAHLRQWRERVKAAQDIFIVGGGAVGIGACPLCARLASRSPFHTEFAGEINEVYPNKKVTIVHGGSKLLTSVYPDKFRDDIERKVRARGINLVFNDYIDDFPELGAQGLTTRKGTRFDTADLVVRSTPQRTRQTLISSLRSLPSVRTLTVPLPPPSRPRPSLRTAVSR